MGCLLLLTAQMANAKQCAIPWPLWEQFAQKHIQADGRVVDFYAHNTTTSEGQSYALFFALVAGDRERFERILHWTENNLAGGHLATQLPAWQWGQAKNGSWGVLDSNSASDADLWIAYDLLQAARIWHIPEYQKMAKSLLKTVLKQEVINIPNLGKVLLPAPVGFALKDKSWRLNPSYSPFQLLRYFAKVDPQGGWNALAKSSFQLIAVTAHQGVVPDWALYRAEQGFQLDAEQGQFSGYDAIRVYLWWAMLSPHDAYFKALKPYVSGAPAFALGATVPERVKVSDGTVSGEGSVGFAAALAPYQHVLYAHSTAIPFKAMPADAGYYSFVLSLFGAGWMEHRFRFGADGSLNVSLKKCKK